VEGRKYIRKDEHGELHMKEKKANKALHLTTYRAGLDDGSCISRAGGTVTPVASLLQR
jgi:hypothetical protein